MSWPLGAAPGGTYTLRFPEDQEVIIPEIILPQDFTIKLPPDWPKDPNGFYLPLRWTAGTKLIFGENAVIDLSPQKPRPAKPSSAASGADGNTGQNGGDGGAGEQGQAGLSGVDLQFYIETWEPLGSLWINTSGQGGGDGGDGGDGGNGGNGKCRAPWGGPDGGKGGDGGNGGLGGRGGDTARVRIEFGHLPLGVGIPRGSCFEECGHASPPVGSNDGIIRIYGAPGCSGRSGRGGRGGSGGSGDNCGILRPNRHPGAHGANGRDTSTELPGCQCFKVPNGRCSNIDVDPAQFG